MVKVNIHFKYFYHKNFHIYIQLTLLTTTTEMPPTGLKTHSNHFNHVHHESGNFENNLWRLH